MCNGVFVWHVNSSSVVEPIVHRKMTAGEKQSELLQALSRQRVGGRNKFATITRKKKKLLRQEKAESNLSDIQYHKKHALLHSVHKCQSNVFYLPKTLSGSKCVAEIQL